MGKGDQFPPMYFRPVYYNGALMGMSKTYPEHSEAVRYVPYTLIDEREDGVRKKGMIDGAREAGYQIMRSMLNQEEAKKAQLVCEHLADMWEKS